MFCPNCGTQIPDESKFCPSCGCGLAETRSQQQKAGSSSQSVTSSQVSQNSAGGTASNPAYYASPLRVIRLVAALVSALVCFFVPVYSTLYIEYSLFDLWKFFEVQVIWYVIGAVIVLLVIPFFVKSETIQQIILGVLLVFIAMLFNKLGSNLRVESVTTVLPGLYLLHGSLIVMALSFLFDGSKKKA